MRNIFIGDIHGCFDEFQELLDKLKISSDDKIYIVGDMINLGPKSVEIIQFLHDNQNQFFAIKGNHEIGFLQYIQGKKPEYENREYIKLKEFCKNKPKILNFIEELPTYIEENKFILVHAGLIPGIPIEKQEEKVLTEIYFYKELPWYFSYPDNEKVIIYGHWAADGLHIRNNTIGLDTHCVGGKYLTAYILEEEKIVQIKAKKEYFRRSKWGYEAELNKKGIYK